MPYSIDRSTFASKLGRVRPKFVARRAVEPFFESGDGASASQTKTVFDLIAIARRRYSIEPEETGYYTRLVVKGCRSAVPRARFRLEKIMVIDKEM